MINLFYQDMGSFHFNKQVINIIIYKVLYNQYKILLVDKPLILVDNYIDNIGKVALYKFFKML